jgi:hypothetical protein
VRDLLVVVAPIALVACAAIWLAVRFVRPAPPDTVRLLSGPIGGNYHTFAERYQKILQGYGVKVEIIPSRGALDNLRRLADPAFGADVGFVQGGLVDAESAPAGGATPTPLNVKGLMSLGSVFPQPLLVYERLPEAIEVVSQLKGKRLAIGPEGSGTRALALRVLKANGIEGPPTVLLDLGGEDAAKALADGSADAAILTGDSANTKVMRSLREIPGVEMMHFRQAAGYMRKLRFLSRLTLPEGAIDLGKNYPPRTYDLIGTTVELVAREDLHPAISDLLITAAREVHGTPGMFRVAGEYPAPLKRDFPISPDAERFYKSGGHFLYKRLPFWLATMVDRLLVVLLPLFVVIVPATRVVPALYRWRVRSRIYRWYGALMAIEREMLGKTTPEQRDEIMKRLDEIENAVNDIRTPLSFADQLYVLRGHVAMVRRGVEASAGR